MSRTHHPTRPRLQRPAGRSARWPAVAALWLASCSIYDSALIGGSDGQLLNAAGTGGDASATGGDDDGGSAAGSQSLGATGGANATGSGGVGSGKAGSSNGGSDSSGSGGLYAVAGEGGAPSGGTGAVADGGGGSSAGSMTTGGSSSVHELATGKSATASSVQTGNEVPYGNDGDPLTRWCAQGSAMPQWWRVDLGEAHELSSVGVSFQHPERTYDYLIETSKDDAVFLQQASLSGMGALQSYAFPPGVSARYVRITVTAATPLVDGTGTHLSWATFFEFSVKGN
jgi:F5/8 type C domain